MAIRQQSHAHRKHTILEGIGRRTSALVGCPGLEPLSEGERLVWLCTSSQSSVSDNGAGMSKAFMERFLFHSFQ